jgi:hypothetical protein
LTPSGGENLCEAQTSKLKEQRKRTKETGSPIRGRASVARNSAAVITANFRAGVSMDTSGAHHRAPPVYEQS